MKLDVTQQEFINLYQNYSYKELQSLLGVSIDTIWKYAKMLKLSKKIGRKPSKDKLQFKEKEPEC